LRYLPHASFILGGSKHERRPGRPRTNWRTVIERELGLLKVGVS